MELSTSLEINFSDKTSTDHVLVSESTLFGFFSCRTYSSRSHFPFSIKKIKGPVHSYKRDNIDLHDNLSVNFVFPTNDERPFVFFLQKSNGKKVYYKVVSLMFIRWTEVDELNGISEEMQSKLLLDTLKKIFSQYFETTLRVSGSIINNKTYTHFDTQYDIVPQVFYCSGYDRYHFSPHKSHSISTVYINDKLNKINGDLRFVRDFFVYYAYYDTSTPLLIETFDYKFGDDIPLYNYYARESLGSDEWSNVECGSNLVDPKCKGDIKRILDVITYHYKMKRIKLDIHNPREQINNPVIKTFDDVPFFYDCKTEVFYGSYCYYPIVSKFFLLDCITLNKVAQVIDVHSLQISIVYVFHTNEEPNVPVLVCVGLFNQINGNTSNYYWYAPKSAKSNFWTKIDFFASPLKDPDMIREKMREICYGGFKIRHLYGPLTKFAAFSLGCLIGLFVGIKFSRRIVLNVARVYHRLRGYQRVD
ncbi:conserved hypothetical protein [Theileria orientalis strain Shintoku]|uniref:Uncharacterized protein n=1 Tax=Theileria orientalis strain Shintoku TaxID=869250 RepID=J4CDB6_THEOR|nr:conserved hypothetical protein [Theileria orientalis strain Shintoku]PVC53468.1 hypothetical protein MACL_00000054 [Theileria orientalis]BAM40857.1 conserved hypothetical protein [Theileria orientalis strain Shintoku]|eukprot:XP_009691158.1 conserved hypothetical protein [Theileria orientalis strain Shintoku]